MNEKSRKDKSDIPEDILEEAVIWQSRLREAGPDSGERRKLRAEFNAWLLADPLHRQAYAEMELLWGVLEEPVAQALTESSQIQKPRPRWLPQLATAACLVLALLMGIGWQQDWATEWQSDYLTGVGEQKPFTLDDGSRIILNTQSAVSVDFSENQRRVKLLKGEAWFDVATDTDRPFVVDAGQGMVKVTGTQFNVKLEDTDARVSLDEGRVQLRATHSAPNDVVTLGPGQQARLTKTGITTPETFDRTAVTAWQRGQFVFYNARLSEVVATLNRYRSGRILITDDRLNKLKVSGVFSTAKPDDALEVIANTLPVEQTRLTNYLVLLR